MSFVSTLFMFLYSKMREIQLLLIISKQLSYNLYVAIFLLANCCFKMNNKSNS